MGTVTEESILEYLKSIEFKHALFGISKTDALLKLRELHQMYRQLLSEHQVSASEKRMQEEKAAAMANAFVNMMEKTSEITLEAERQAKQIVAEAQKQADEMLEAAARKAEELLTGCRQEMERTLERQMKKIREETAGKAPAPAVGITETPRREKEEIPPDMDLDIGITELGIRLKELKKDAAAGSEGYALR